MEQNPPWEANSHSASAEFSHLIEKKSGIGMQAMYFL
jgi:hypothetical protein